MRDICQKRQAFMSNFTCDMLKGFFGMSAHDGLIAVSKRKALTASQPTNKHFRKR